MRYLTSGSTCSKGASDAEIRRTVHRSPVPGPRLAAFHLDVFMPVRRFSCTT